MSLLTKIWGTPAVTEPLAPRDAEAEVEIIAQFLQTFYFPPIAFKAVTP